MFGVFVLLILCSLKSAEELFCGTADGVKYLVTWPQTSTKTVSNPLCLNSKQEFVYRECVDGLWGKEPECFYIQQQKQPQCPEGFVDDGNICYIFSNTSKFPGKCPFEDVLSFNIYQNYVVNLPNPIWMPIKKDPKYGVFQWLEASNLYKTIFEGHFHLFGSFDHKDCLLFYNASYIAAVSCDEKHISVCAYDHLNYLDGHLCGTKCQRSDFPQESNCFCEGDEKHLEVYPKAEFRKSYQIYDKANCTIGLEKTSSGYIWINSQNKVNYTFWSNSVVFDQDHIYGAVTPEGWLLTTKHLKCILYEKLQIILEPSLQLNLEGNVFTVSISNITALKYVDGKPLIYCFSNAKSSELIHRYEFNNGVYQFFAEPGESGEYWCEAFKYSNIEITQSNKFVIKEIIRKPEFIAIFKIYNILNDNYINRSIQNLLFEILNVKFDYIKNYDMRVMRILNINAELKSIVVNVRFTFKCSNCNTTTIDKEYVSLKTDINTILCDHEVDITLEDFRPFSYCISSQNNFFWPATEAGTSAGIKEFCFAQGMQIQRECLFDFIDGAQWSTENDCELMEQSPITNELAHLQQEASEKICFKLKELAQVYETFKTIDIYLTENILYKCVEFDEDGMLINFLLVYDVLMNLNKTILEQAELKLWVTSSLLYTFFYPFHRSNQTILPLIQNNFVYTKSHVSTLTGIVLQKTSIKQKAMYLTKDDKIEDIASIQNLDSAILLNPRYSDQENPTSSVSFTIFFNNTLFIEDKTFFKNPKRIFSASFKESEQGLDDAIWVLTRKNQKDTTDYMCAIWTYGDRIGWWKILASPKIYKSFYLCKFPAQSDIYYSVISLDNIVTNKLNELVQCDCSVTELLQGLQDISDHRYSDFTSKDIYLAAKILEKVTFSDDFDLEVVVAIVNNLDKINPNILEESEVTEGATTLILNYFLILLQKYKLKDITKIERSNFMVFISLLKEASLYGLVKFDDYLDPVNDDNLSDIFDEFFDVTILLSGSLKAQLHENDKIIITMFESSALFQSSSSISLIGTIVGVHLPLENYAGPIYIFHKLSEIQTSKCVSWSHSTPDAIGSWQIIADGKTMSNLIMCKIRNNSHVALITIDNTTDHISLDLVTVVNSGISFIALSTLVITYDKKNMFLFYVAINNIFHLILLDFSKRLLKNSNKICITVTSTSVQYSIWFFYTILTTFVVSQNKLFLSKINNSIGKFIFTWFCSLLPIVISWISNNRNCFEFTTGLYLYIWHPISVTFSTNSFILSYVDGQNNKANTHLKFLLGTILVLFWILGIYANLGVFKYFSIYLFSFLTSLQGLIIVVFVITSSTNYARLSTIQKVVKVKKEF